MGFLVIPAAAQPVTITNVLQQHYQYGFPVGNQDCPAGYNLPAGQYSSAYHLERGHAIHHLDPKNAANDYWVYWAHFDNASYGIAEVAVFKSKTECGPYILQSALSNPYSIDGSGYGFQPGGWQSRDENIFRDSDQTYNPDGSVASYASAYLVTASNSLNTIPGNPCSYANDSLAGFKMTPDYLGIDPTTNPGTHGANWIFPCAQREAPVMFRQGNTYFLIVSQAAGWYPSQGAYGVSSNPLTGWTASPINLGNSSTFGGQTSDGFVIQGTKANTYVLSFDHLGGDDSKNPAYVNERHDTGGMLLPVFLDGAARTATLNWYPSWTVDNTTGELTLPTLNNLATSGTASSTIAVNSTNPPSYAADGNYTTRWAGLTAGSSAFNPAKPATSTLCPVTGATASTVCNPSLVVDLGSVRPVQEIDLSWYEIKGSELIYNFKIAYSNDNATWSTLDYTSFAPGLGSPASNLSVVPFSVNNTYGFNFLPVNFSARYVALMETGVIQSNGTQYPPGLFEMGIIQSTAPATAQPATVTVTPSTGSPATGASFTVGVTVAGPIGSPAPTGYIQLSAPGYTSETLGLVNGANSFVIPAGALPGGATPIAVNYRADPTSAPVYGIGTTSGSAGVFVSAPGAPTNLNLAQSSPGALTVSWTAAVGAASYSVSRSTDGAGTFTQVATTAATSYTDTGLNNDSTTYCYTVTAVNGAGPGMATAPVCGTATANFPVTGIAVTQSGPGALTVSYNAVANTTGYLIKRSVSGGAYNTLATATSTAYTDSGLATGTTYCYTAAAVFSTGTASDSSPVCGTVIPGFAPTGVTVKPTANGQLTVAWSSGSTVSTSYLLKRSINGAPYTTIVPSQTALAYADKGLTNYTSMYCYVVDAVLNGETSTDSVAVCNAPIFFLTIPNYSFEAPATTSYVYGPQGASWAFTASASAVGSGVTTNGSGFTAGNSPAPDGTQVAFLQGTGSATQTVGGFTAGQTYSLTVAASERQNKSGGQLGNPFTISVNGATLVTVTAPQAAKTYADYSATFAAAASSQILAFAGTNALASPPYTDNTVFLDNVRVSPLGTAAAAITVQPVTMEQGTAFTTLTATETFRAGTIPQGTLVFQVDNGDQVPGSCMISSGAAVCSATYPTANVPFGPNIITVSYAGDVNYAASSGTANLTVAPRFVRPRHP